LHEKAPRTPQVEAPIEETGSKLPEPVTVQQDVPAKSWTVSDTKLNTAA
jgi:hypothetical protein